VSLRCDAEHESRAAIPPYLAKIREALAEHAHCSHHLLRGKRMTHTHTLASCFGFVIAAALLGAGSIACSSSPSEGAEENAGAVQDERSSSGAAPCADKACGEKCVVRSCDVPSVEVGNCNPTLLTAKLGICQANGSCNVASDQPPSCAVIKGLVISQVYGGGGNRGAVFDQDFVELFNRSDRAISLKGLSVQYAPGTPIIGYSYSFEDGRLPQIPLPDVMLEPGRYFLIGMGSGQTGDGKPLPQPDIQARHLQVAAKGGKVALAHGTSAIKVAPGDANRAIDRVGSGSTTDDFEGHPTLELSTTLAAVRRGAGCIDQNDNMADFAIEAPSPRNMVSAPSPCETSPAR